MQTSCERAEHASNVLRPGREPHWFHLTRPTMHVSGERREGIILSRILETVCRKTITRNEEGAE